MSVVKKINNSTGRRLTISVIGGMIASLLALLNHLGSITILIGWDVAIVIFVVWVWLIIGRMNHEQTAHFALREDPTRTGADVLLISAAIASLVAIAFTVVEARNTHVQLHSVILTAICVTSVVLAWILIHTIYTLRYATLHYSDKSGKINFSMEREPAYSEFAYFAFTIGMTFQISNDSQLAGTGFRKVILQHAILSYIFNTVIIATTISLVAGFGS